MQVTPDNLKREFLEKGYWLNEEAAKVLYLAILMEKPLLVEGPAGTGKTMLGEVLAGVMGSDLIRLQCYEGIDESKALFEWDYARQLLYIQSVGSGRWEELEAEIYSEKFLLPRPLLKAITSQQKATLIIDEIDKSDEEFESLLLELLSQWQVSIPQLGTVYAATVPYVIITSNNQRRLSEALKRRCLYLYLDYPQLAEELAAVRCHIPEIEEQFAVKLLQFVQRVRRRELIKPPGTAETIDWIKAIRRLDEDDEESMKTALAALLKEQKDLEKVKSDWKRLWG
ncbi:MAG: MoxR family ATPase [Thermoanaerobacteraceae bacterium]|nr:MoxR family ATPase [Thermoanaerobacteraceae bacterium]